MIMVYARLKRVVTLDFQEQKFEIMYVSTDNRVDVSSYYEIL